MVNGQCRNPLAVTITFMECCCGVNMGKGWGGPPCQLCPIPGTGRYRTYFINILLEHDVQEYAIAWKGCFVTDVNTCV